MSRVYGSLSRETPELDHEVSKMVIMTSLHIGVLWKERLYWPLFLSTSVIGFSVWFRSSMLIQHKPSPYFNPQQQRKSVSEPLFVKLDYCIFIVRLLSFISTLLAYSLSKGIVSFSFHRVTKDICCFMKSVSL